ncbi:MAG: cytochrome P450, partial [Prochlorothrix sp.]
MTTPPSVQVLDLDTPIPTEVGVPPRQPRWNDTLAYIADPDRFCRTNLQKHGPIFKTSVFGGTTVFVGSPAAVEMVFNGDNQYTEIGLPPATLEMFGPYSLFQRPDLHRERKSALSPGFSGPMLANYIPTLHQIAAQGLASWSTTTTLALFPAVERLCFTTLVPILLGLDIHHGNRALAGLPIDTVQDLKQCYKTFFEGFYGLVPWNLPFTAFGRGLRARSQLMDFMAAVIQQRRSQSHGDRSTQAPGNADATPPLTNFLDMMLMGQREDPNSVFEDELIRNQCLLQLWASHYEISGLVSSWIYQVVQNPAVLERIRSEIAEGVSQTDQLETLSLADLKNLPYLEASFKETLRILPPSSTANRRLTRSVLLDGVLYRRGWVLIAEPRIAHVLAENFPNPDRFEPDRFLGDRTPGGRYGYIPFGGGVHACLGAQLALTFAKIFALHLLQRFSWNAPANPPFVQFPLKHIQDSYQID